MVSKDVELVDAYVVESSTSDFKLEKLPLNKAGPLDVTVEFVCSGLCHTDIHMQKNDWGISVFPQVLGHEGVGKVVAIGESVRSIKLGETVGVGWISNSCGDCGPCHKGEENICDSGYEGTYLGKNAMFGTFQRKQVYNEKFVYKVPESLPVAIAAPLLCAGITVYAPIHRYVKPGMNVGIISMGGLGHMAVQFAKQMGAEVTVYSTSKNKEADAKMYGATRLVVFKDQNADEFKARFAQEDFILNTCPYTIPFEGFSNCLKKNGVLAFVGIPEAEGNEVKINLYNYIFNQKTFAGSIVGGGVDMRNMIEFVTQHGLKTSVEVHNFSELNTIADRLIKGDMSSYRFVLCWDNAKKLQDEATEFCRST